MVTHNEGNAPSRPIKPISLSVCPSFVVRLNISGTGACHKYRVAPDAVVSC
jgi:hypothetical protein